MGNRAVITCAKKPSSRSLGVCLYWNGGLQSVRAFVDTAGQLKIRWGHEAYAVARMVQIIGNYFGGATSIGVGKPANLDCDN